MCGGGEPDAFVIKRIMVENFTVGVICDSRFVNFDPNAIILSNTFYGTATFDVFTTPGVVITSVIALFVCV